MREHVRYLRRLHGRAWERSFGGRWLRIAAYWITVQVVASLAHLAIRGRDTMMDELYYTLVPTFGSVVFGALLFFFHLAMAPRELLEEAERSRVTAEGRLAAATAPRATEETAIAQRFIAASAIVDGKRVSLADMLMVCRDILLEGCDKMRIVVRVQSLIQLPNFIDMFFLELVSRDLVKQTIVPQDQSAKVLGRPPIFPRDPYTTIYTLETKGKRVVDEIARIRAPELRELMKQKMKSNRDTPSAPSR